MLASNVLTARCCLLRQNAVPYSYCKPSFVRSHSTAVSASATTATSSVASAETPEPQLVQVPSLPILGSSLPIHSGMPKLKQTSVYEFWPEMKRRFGNFYSFGMPGLGKGLHGTCHVIQDPHEMAKILRREGKFPSGAAEFSWAFSKFFEDRNMSVGGIVKNGPEWKRIRNFIQTDLLTPASAARYLPLVIEAAPGISRGAPQYSQNLNHFLNLASFDMFSNIMLGQKTRITDPEHQSDPEDELFCSSVAEALRINSEMMQTAYHAIMAKVLGVETSLYKQFAAHWDAAQAIGDKKIDALVDKRNSTTSNTLTPNEEACYANQAFARSETDDKVTLDEAKTIISGLLSAGVDTTGGMLSWKLLHLATSPKAQEKIYQELMRNGGKITPESVSATKAPYLHACLRESHRLANPNVMIPLKRIPTEVTVHGVPLPPDSVILLDGYSTGVDPNLVQDPLEFRPSRFLSDAVAARKGTPSEKVDHVFFSGPFSQGARKCPGSRVANLEAAVIVAQLVLDWEIAVPSIDHWTDVSYDLQTVTTAQLPPMEFTPRRGF